MKQILIKGRVSEIEAELVGTVGGYFPGNLYDDHIYYAKAIKTYFIQRVNDEAELDMDFKAWMRVSKDVIDYICGGN